MNMQLKPGIFLIFFTACLLSACGFTLRGTAKLPSELQTLALQSTNGNSGLLQDLRRALTANNVTIVEMPEPETYRLVIGAVSSSERILSVDSNARAGEYELSLSVPFQLRSAQSIAIEREILTIEKVYLADPSSAVAKAEERELMENEMRRELVVLILRRLQSASL